MINRVLSSVILSTLLAFLFTSTGCKTPDGLRYPLPPQAISEPTPDGLSRVVLYNNSNRVIYFESGPIRIQLDGQQLPSVWLDHYIQAFVAPGIYDLNLEHYDIFFWKGAHKVAIDAPVVYLELYNLPTSTRVRRVQELPADFHSRWKPGRDPESW